MKRTYVPICYDIKYQKQIFYDYDWKEFFYTQEENGSGIAKSLVGLSGTAGVLLYSFTNTASFETGLTRIQTVLLAMMIGAILSFMGSQILMFFTKKVINERSVIVSPTVGEIADYIIEGRMQTKKSYKIVTFLLFLSLFCSTYLYFVPISMLFMLITPASWALFIFIIWAIRPIKRMRTYRQFENEIQAYRGD